MYFFPFIFALISVISASTFAHPNIEIIGGENVTIEEYPYQLSLLYKNTHICGATIIAENWAVTAARCTDQIPSESLSIRAGSSILETGGQEISVKQIYQHQNYTYLNKDWDISLLELETNIQFDNGSAQIELADVNITIADGTNATISGWGYTSNDNLKLSAQLQAAVESVVNQEICKEAYVDYGMEITENMLCAGSYKGDVGACIGDYGGPLVIDGKLVGITSWGIECASPDFPDIYTRVSAFRDFIYNVTGL